MGPRTWSLLYIETEKNQARFSNFKAVDTYVLALVRRNRSEQLPDANQNLYKGVVVQNFT